MPVVKRLVRPVNCNRTEIPKGVKDELEAFAVNSLSNVILQLSSLAKHSESIFSELFTEANSIYQRTVSAQQRIDQLSIKVTKLDSAGEEISLQEINIQKAFKLTIHSDQQVISRKTMPEAMEEAYKACDPVPDLHLLSKFRHDNKDSLKFYTDPDYFFELWKEKMSAEFEKRRKKRKRENRGKRREVGEKKQVKGVKKKEIKNIPDWEIQDRAKKNGSGTVISDPSPVTSPKDSPAHSLHSGGSTSPHLSPRRHSYKRASNASSIGRPTVAPPPPPPGGSPARHPGVPPPPPPPPIPGQHHSPRPMSPPPPPPINGSLPPPPDFFIDQGGSMPLPPPIVTVAGGGGPPPPPPPPVMGGGPLPPPPPAVSSGGSGAGGISSNILQSVTLSAPKPAPEPEPDTRTDLLSAIRTGMNLRKTQQVTKEEKKEANMGNDVASILARRIAVEFSDSEGDDSDSDGEWSDD